MTHTTALVAQPPGSEQFGQVGGVDIAVTVEVGEAIGLLAWKLVGTHVQEGQQYDPRVSRQRVINSASV